MRALAADIAIRDTMLSAFRKLAAEEVVCGVRREDARSGREPGRPAAARQLQRHRPPSRAYGAATRYRAINGDRSRAAALAELGKRQPSMQVAAQRAARSAQLQRPRGGLRRQRPDGVQHASDESQADVKRNFVAKQMTLKTLHVRSRPPVDDYPYSLHDGSPAASTNGALLEAWGGKCPCVKALDSKLGRAAKLQVRWPVRLCVSKTAATSAARGAALRRACGQRKVRVGPE